MTPGWSSLTRRAISGNAPLKTGGAIAACGLLSLVAVSCGGSTSVNLSTEYEVARAKGELADRSFRQFDPPEDNPLGAWYWRSDIAGPQGGILSGKTLALMANVCVAGIPIMNGTSVPEGYVPDVDATIVTRILDAGAPPGPAQRIYSRRITRYKL